jgi:hypothetical protein
MGMSESRADRAVWFVTAILLMLLTTSASAGWNCGETHVLEATQPLNIGQLKFQLRDYRYCGGYGADFAKKIAEAIAYVRERASQVERPALVLDIDETSLSNCSRSSRTISASYRPAHARCSPARSVASCNGSSARAPRRSSLPSSCSTRRSPWVSSSSSSPAGRTDSICARRPRQTSSAPATRVGKTSPCGRSLRRVR